MSRAAGLTGTLPFLRYALATTIVDPSVLLVSGLIAVGPLAWSDSPGAYDGSILEILQMQLVLGATFSHVAFFIWVLRRARTASSALARAGLCGARAGLGVAVYGAALAAASPAGLLVSVLAVRRHGAAGFVAVGVAMPLVCGSALALVVLTLLGVSQRAWPDGILRIVLESRHAAGCLVALLVALLPIWAAMSPLGSVAGPALAAAGSVALVGVLSGPVERLARGR